MTTVVDAPSRTRALKYGGLRSIALNVIQPDLKEARDKGEDRTCHVTYKTCHVTYRTRHVTYRTRHVTHRTRHVTYRETLTHHPTTLPKGGVTGGTDGAGKPDLLAHNVSVDLAPVVVTDSPPLSGVEHLHSAFSF